MDCRAGLVQLGLSVCQAASGKGLCARTDASMPASCVHGLLLRGAPTDILRAFLSTARGA